MPFAGRYAFVAGLHRTGTSLTARILGQSPDVSAISGSPAPEDEGCYLQGAIPHTALHGIPGHYATDPAQHLIEGSRYDTLATRERIAADWDRWYGDTETKWRIEKSPVNLTRMRLYQQLFPMCQFVVLLRHPAFMAAALAKWVDTPPADLIDYAILAYERMERDCRYLHGVLVLRYEDLVARPCTKDALFRFLDAAPGRNAIALRDGNLDYPKPPGISADQAQRLARWGYGEQGEVFAYDPIVQHPLRAVREAVLETLSRGG